MCSIARRNCLGGRLGRLNVLGMSGSQARPTPATEVTNCNFWSGLDKRRHRSERSGAPCSSISRRGCWPTKLLTSKPQLDKPTWQKHCSYPNDITIDPPVR